MDELVKIYNLLIQLEVRGQSVLLLSDAIRYLQKYIETAQNQSDSKEKSEKID